MDVFKYLDGRQSLYLKSVNYSLNTDVDNGEKEFKLNDELFVNSSLKDGLKIAVTRKISDVSSEEYLLEITMGCTLFFKNTDDVTKDVIEKIDWKKELKDHSQILSTLIARISLLISQITSSFGGVPIVTPPNFITEQ